MLPHMVSEEEIELKGGGRIVSCLTHAGPELEVKLLTKLMSPTDW